MEILSVVAKRGDKFPNTFLNEKCLWSTSGYYVGLDTGTHYDAADHYHCQQYRAIVKPADAVNLTGMYHLNEDLQANPADSREENDATRKNKYVGCLVTVEEAHFAGEVIVYRCLELEEYFTSNELDIISPQKAGKA